MEVIDLVVVEEEVVILEVVNVMDVREEMVVKE